MQTMQKRRRVAIYARVSTASQTVENQLIELRTVAQRAGWQIVAELTDNGISGTKGRDQRPAFDEPHGAYISPRSQGCHCDRSDKQYSYGAC